MKTLPTNLGAEPKKLAVLGAIVLLGGGLVYWADSGNDAPPQAAAPQTTLPSTVGALPINATPPRTTASNPPNGPKLQTRGGNSRTTEDFRPSLKLPEGTDVSRIDPRLKTELLARLRAVPDQGGNRSVFEFYVPPASPPPVQPIKPVQQTSVVAPPPQPTKPSGPPPPPPIPLKLYGFAGPPGKTRKAIFLDGEDVLIGSENDVLRNRYRIIRVGVVDAEVEDTATKNRETIRIIPENDA